MRSALEDLPVELVELLVSLIEIRDIGSLRLTCCALADKTSRGRFTTFFTNKNVLLTIPNLRDMVSVTGRGRIGCRLRDCTITGVIRVGDNGASEETGPEEIEEHKRLLAEAFTNLKLRSSTGGLASLSLRVAVMRAGQLVPMASANRKDESEIPSQDQVWNVAANSFDTATMALQKSRLNVEQCLDIFNSMKGCSLRYSLFVEFVKGIWLLDSGSLFSAIKKVSVHLSAPPDSKIDPPTRLAEQKSVSPPLSTMLGLLRKLPALKTLEMHWYLLPEPTSVTQVPSKVPWQQIGFSTEPDQHTAMRLEECVLRGVYCLGSELLRFLDLVNPMSLTLDYCFIFFEEDTCDRLFRYLTQPECPIKEYCLEYIHDKRKVINYRDAPPATLGILKRSMGHQKTPIQWYVNTARTIDSPGRRYWQMRRYEDFGGRHPLGIYNFLALNSWPNTVYPAPRWLTRRLE